MHEHQDNKNMSWRISNHNQKNQNEICIKNSKIQKIQKINEKKIAECNNLHYFVNKKLLVVFKRLQKHNRKQLKNIKNQQTEEQDIKLIINIKKRKIQVLINNISDISYMNSQLQKSLEIKEKEQKQLLIMKNTK